MFADSISSPLPNDQADARVTDWRDHCVMVFDGATDSRKGTKRNYLHMTLGEVVAMEHDAQPKDRARAMIPSSYNAPEARGHDPQRAHGSFVALCLDIDEGNHDLEQVAGMVGEFTGGEAASLIYSTSSASSEQRKWRAVIPLEAPLKYDGWRSACERLFDFAAAQGIEVDRSLSRAGQPVYLPNIAPERRDPDGRPLFAERRFVDGRGLRMTDPGLTEWWAARQAAPAPESAPASMAAPMKALRTAARRMVPGPIQRFNDAHPLEEMFLECGYTPAPSGGGHWRSPLQTSDSFATQIRTGDDGSQYWISLSASDAAAGLGRPTESGARTGDAFDVHSYYEHGNDADAALAAWRAEEGRQAAAAAAAAAAIAVAAEAGDVGAPFEPQALATLLELRDADPAAWARIRARLRAAKVGLGELDRAMKAARGGDAEDDRSATDRMIELARSRCRFVHDAHRDPFAICEVAGTRQVHRVLSSSFADFLSHAYYEELDRAPTEHALKTALATLRGQAQFDGEEREIFTRIAKTPTGYWLDLCNDAWQCVQITAAGWDVVAGEHAPLFTRSPTMRALPVPMRGGTLDALWPLVNIPQADRLTVVAWMLECMRADTPHVVLELVGEQGSAKSSTQRALRRLIDPNQADLRAAPKAAEDVWVAARNAHMVSLENLSYLAPQYQDALCVLATGGGFASRKLYTNDEEAVVNLRKPIVLNGISVIVTAQDLVDRTIHIDLPTIHNRELAADMDARFEAAQPALLGALLDLFVNVLATLPAVDIPPEQRPRMADFSLLGEAVFRVHGEPPGAFLQHHLAMRRDSVLATLDASPVGCALLKFLDDHPGGFAGSLSDLLVRLEVFRPTHEAWPRSPKGLGDALRRLAPAMRMVGFECKSSPKTGGAIQWLIFPKGGQPGACPASPASPGLPPPAMAEGGAGHAGLAGHRSDGDPPQGKSRVRFNSPMRRLTPPFAGVPV